jgi:hypothetical protein
MERSVLNVAAGCIVAALFSVACTESTPPASDKGTSVSSLADPSLGEESLADQVVRSEIVIEGLRVPLAALSKSVVNLRLPDERGRGVLEPAVTIVDLAAAPEAAREPLLDLGFEQGRWPVAGESLTVATQELSLWKEFLATVEFFHHFNFYNVRGEFRGQDLYHTDSGFKGLAQLKSGEIAAIQGKLGLDWHGALELVGDAEQTVWRIARFETKSFDFVEGPEPLFVDVGDVAFDLDAWRATIASPRDEGTVATVLDIRSGALAMDDYLEAGRNNLEAAGDGGMDTTQTVVVDVDRDGFDDLYVTGAFAKSTFFHNNGDGTFTDVTQELGLDFDGVLSATFADLDNDGDPDLFLSRFNREEATRYLVNEGGKYVDRTASLGFALPNYVIPIAVSDFNNDGLLDVYLARYANVYMASMMIANERGKAETGMYPDEFPFLDEQEARLVLERNRQDGHPLAKSHGPRNWLMVNRGDGRFERATEAGDVNGNFNTLAVAWTDMDLDGDMDLYLVSESGPNELMRNNGDGTFSEVASGVSAEIGFGMGAGLGDYDNDGRTDVYMTNMYSKAGLRISEQMDSSEMIVQSARGNTLMRNTEEGFVKVSSLDGSGIQVEAADFGWGGAFADLNNDAHLDLYVPAGQQSVPQEVATIGDS